MRVYLFYLALIWRDELRKLLFLKYVSLWILMIVC